ncbi:amidohydrolase family protein [Actinomadura fulvescens]|uniref:amidohydrolase family protein n=1 Tax=Actinomadura fulvescens TaxID=46160 RepID=UPI0031D4E193
MDVHNHFTPPEIVADARRGNGIDGLRVERDDGVEWMVHQRFRWQLQPTFYDLEARLQAMDKLGVDLALISMAPPLFMYWVADTSALVDLCRQANDELAAFAAASDGRIEAVATLPMSDPDAAVTELRRAIGELGLKGAQIGPSVEDMPIDDPAVRPVLATAAELGAPVILHPYHVGPRPGLTDYYLYNLVGNPLESTVGAARLIFGGVLDELDRLKVLLIHGGGYLPYHIGRLDRGHLIRAENKGCRHAPSAYLRRFWYDTIVHGAGPLEFLIQQVGVDRVVYGTDFPFGMSGGSLLEQLDGVAIGDSDRARVAGGNAADLFGLGDGT